MVSQNCAFNELMHDLIPFMVFGICQMVNLAPVFPNVWCSYCSKKKSNEYKHEQFVNTSSGCMPRINSDGPRMAPDYFEVPKSYEYPNYTENPKARIGVRSASELKNFSIENSDKMKDADFMISCVKWQIHHPLHPSNWFRV